VSEDRPWLGLVGRANEPHLTVRAVSGEGIPQVTTFWRGQPLLAPDVRVIDQPAIPPAARRSTRRPRCDRRGCAVGHHVGNEGAVRRAGLRRRPPDDRREVDKRCPTLSEQVDDPVEIPPVAGVAVIV